MLWFTGLSGAGKTTLSKRVHEALVVRGLSAEHLDGDTLRAILPNTGFSKEARNEHVRRVGFLASQLERHGVFVITSLISPYEESRAFVRSLCKNFVEIHVATPLEVCEKRDVKGLYARARRGEIRDFTGIDSDYEVPRAAELVIDGSLHTEEESAQLILDYVKKYIG